MVYNITMYIFLDNEMGGLDKEKYSLLSSYLMIVNDDFQFVDDLYLYLKPDDEIYKVCGEAMNINHIDLKVHDTKAITYKEGATKLYKWLHKATDGGKIKLTPAGHGVYGDIEWLTHYTISRGSWEVFVSYRKLDTQAVVQFLKSCGVFPEIDGSLESLARHFGIAVNESSLHDAKYDTELTFQVFMKLRKQFLFGQRDKDLCEGCIRFP